MRIAYIAVKGIPACGGIETVTEEIGSRLVKRGHQVTVYSSRDYGTREDAWHKGMEIKTVPSINTKAFHKLSICFHATRDVMRRRNADLVHFHAVGPSIFSIFPRLAGIPTVVQVHGLEWMRDKWGLMAKTFFRLSDYTVACFPTKATAVSMVQKDYYERRFRKEIVYIPNGVKAVHRESPDWILRCGLVPGRYILFAARLVEEKGAHLLISAFRALDTDMSLVIAGDAAHSGRYKARLRDLAGDDARIFFPGFVAGKPLQELFSNAYLFCLPSTLEGMPVALLEAMSYGNCCVASDIRENREALEDYGYTFENRNTDDLRRVIRELIAQPHLVEAKKSVLREYVRNIPSWDRVTDMMEQLYLSMVPEGRQLENPPAPPFRQAVN